MKSLRLLVAVSVLLAVLVYARACVFRPATHFDGAHFNRGTNAAWLGIEWVNEAHTRDEIGALAHDLQRYQIRTLFVYTSYLKPTKQFNPTFAFARDFILTIKAAYPAVNVQAWLGLPLGGADSTNPRYHVDLSDAPTRLIIVAFCAELVRTQGYDGIHLDPEPARSDDVHLLQLLDEVRVALGPQPILSIAALRYWPIPIDAPLVSGGTIGWSKAYYRQIALRVDQLAVMTYDSGLFESKLYRQWTQAQIVAVTQAVAGLPVELFFGVPISEEQTLSHLPFVENMTSGLTGIIAGLNDNDTQPVQVVGIAIYPYWETNATKWAVYERLWLGK